MLSKSLHGRIHGGFSKGYPVPVTGYRLTEVINNFLNDSPFWGI